MNNRNNPEKSPLPDEVNVLVVAEASGAAAVLSMHESHSARAPAVKQLQAQGAVVAGRRICHHPDPLPRVLNKPPTLRCAGSNPEKWQKSCRTTKIYLWA